MSDRREERVEPASLEWLTVSADGGLDDKIDKQKLPYVLSHFTRYSKRPPFPLPPPLLSSLRNK